MEYSVAPRYNNDEKQWVVEITGEIDIFNSNDFKDSLVLLYNQQNSDLKLDLLNLDYLDSTALGALVAVYKHVKIGGNDLILTHVKPHILKLMKITNLDKLFVIEGERNE